MSARKAPLHSLMTRAESRWVVELVLPQGTFECRPLVTCRARFELDWEAHATLAELQAWKPTWPECAGYRSFSVFCGAAGGEIPATPPRRLLLAHFGDPEAARLLAEDLTFAMSHPEPPWTEACYAVFQAHLRRVRAAWQDPAVCRGASLRS